MTSRPKLPASRYRRRILGIGALAIAATYAIGAPVFNTRIESDLESRVPTELADDGFPGVTASFSGQDGTLRCAAPLDDPEGARARAYDVWGVRAIELDRSCRVNTGGDAAAETSADASSADDSGDDPAGTDDIADETAVSTSTTPADDTGGGAELATVAEIVAADSDLTFLTVLLDGVDLGVDGDLTLFAPDNDAFNDVPSDVLARLRDDPELLQRVLGHHVVAGVTTSDELVDGDLDSVDGGQLTVVTGSTITVGGASLISPDVLASNGVVHVIDTVLLPDDVDLTSASDAAAAVAEFDGTSIVLTGVVASEVERQVLVTAATDVVGADAVTDELTVDPDVGLDGDTAARVAGLITAMSGNLASGEAGFDGSDPYLTGVYLNDAGRDAAEAAADLVDVEPDLEAPPEADDDDAADLEAELNAFVTANPILFEPNSAVLDDSATTILDQLAVTAQRFAGVELTIEGHTDSDGSSAVNLQLSQDRSDAVRLALIDRGLSEDAIEAIGFGSDQPVLVDGVEDKAASRRVEFRVVTAA